MKLNCISAVLTVTIMMSLSSCSQGNGKGTEDSDTIVLFNASRDSDPVADNDIAMTVRSIADAMNYGEKLDSAVYDYSGVLTDGRSKPLYTDIDGMPGMWDVDVESPSRVVITNLKVGDLFTDALREYITVALGVGEEERVHAPDHGEEECENGDCAAYCYDFGKGTILFETRETLVSGNREGALMKIILSGKNV